MHRMNDIYNCKVLAYEWIIRFAFLSCGGGHIRPAAATFCSSFDPNFQGEILDIFLLFRCVLLAELRLYCIFSIASRKYPAHLNSSRTCSRNLFRSAIAVTLLSYIFSYIFGFRSTSLLSHFSTPELILESTSSYDLILAIVDEKEDVRLTLRGMCQH